MSSLHAPTSEPQASVPSQPAQPQHILVLGGGLIGSAIALELRLRGCEVMVLSRDRQEAAGYAAAGMLAPQAEKLSGAMLELCLRSRDLYPEWVAKLESLTGQPVGYWSSGILNPVYELPPTTDPAASQAQSRGPQSGTLQDGPATQWLDAATILAQQPGLGAEVVGGWWFPQDAQVDNRRRLMEVLYEAIAQTGVHWEEGVSIEQITVEQVVNGQVVDGQVVDGQVIDKQIEKTGQIEPQKAATQTAEVRAIQTSQGLRQADHYIWAMGAWSDSIPGLDIPVYPRKGQLLSLRAQKKPTAEATAQSSTLQSSTAPSSSIQPLQQVLYGDYVYIVPRQDGLIVVGATAEDVAFTPGNTAAGIQTLLNEAIRLYPPLKDFELVETWWGYRPATPDELPILGASPLKNLTLATGHYRNGVLLTPITAQLIADWVLDPRKTDPLLAAFRWDRFTV